MKAPHRIAALLFAGALLAPPGAGFAGATETICSDPARAEIKAAARLRFDERGTRPIEALLANAETQLGMTDWSLVGHDFSIYGLQSPKVSLLIRVTWRPGASVGVASVERTCIDDNLEDWEPYWDKFLTAMTEQGQGWELHPWPKSAAQ
ncbi:hypothetical protein BWQ93_18725 [Sphingopyxis sp. QXT-31]|uniref:hypothetical protein n=1 Tax=Sphingopyxis sp. QXT-31 TaxID=1357916 RepID=UPI00097932C0|nr:hypothetical protein [Sphingopyxis sp. QXT-31]AQA00266.1 hypothetical protein BWQ93_18725 [Sphingopyxis sp. QXT-31]